jgi:hypothetical protein
MSWIIASHSSAFGGGAQDGRANGLPNSRQPGCYAHLSIGCRTRWVLLLIALVLYIAHIHHQSPVPAFLWFTVFAIIVALLYGAL